MSSHRYNTRFQAKKNAAAAEQSAWTPNPVQLQAEMDSIAAQDVPYEEKKYVAPLKAHNADSNTQSSKLNSDPFWNLKYTRLSDQTNLKDQNTLMDAIFWHENRCENEAWEELKNGKPGWEYELICAVRWLCIDNRILKESAMMRDKAGQYADRVNDLLGELEKKRHSLTEQVWLSKTEGCEFDKLHQELLKTDLLAVTAHHVFDKYCQVMNEVVRETHADN
jgi:hypothetical protein